MADRVQRQQHSFMVKLNVESGRYLRILRYLALLTSVRVCPTFYFTDKYKKAIVNNFIFNSMIYSYMLFRSFDLKSYSIQQLIMKICRMKPHQLLHQLSFPVLQWLLTTFKYNSSAATSTATNITYMFIVIHWLIASLLMFVFEKFIAHFTSMLVPVSNVVHWHELVFMTQGSPVIVYTFNKSYRRLIVNMIVEVIRSRIILLLSHKNVNSTNIFRLCSIRIYLKTNKLLINDNLCDSTKLNSQHNPQHTGNSGREKTVNASGSIALYVFWENDYARTVYDVTLNQVMTILTEDRVSPREQLLRVFLFIRLCHYSP